MINIQEFDKVIKQAREIALKKNADYGDSGLLLFKAQGILIRMNDKLGRLNYFFENKDKDLNFESIDDNIIDLINYAVYLHLYLNNKLIKENAN